MNYENLQILATLGSALAVYVFIRMGARKEVLEIEKRIDRLETKVDKVDTKIDRMDEKLQQINIRLTRLEGRFDERGYWESREYHKTGTEDKK